MILSDQDIRAAMQRGEIDIQPFRNEKLGPNSYDVHLSRRLMVTDYHLDYSRIDPAAPSMLDAKWEPQMKPLIIGPEGFVLRPGKLYLGCTVERTVTRKHIPFLEGRSSTGRLGISIHATAGKGDIGFAGHWTMEISVIEPVRVYAGMPIGQILFHAASSLPDISYNQRISSHYGEQPNFPVASRMHLSNFLDYESA